MKSKRSRIVAKLSSAAVPVAALSFQFFVGLQTGVAQVQHTWIGTTGNWGDAANWESEGASPPPNALDATTFIGNNGVVNLNAGSFQAESVHIGHSGPTNAGTGVLNVGPGSYLYASNDSYIGNGNNGTLNITGGHFVLENTEHLFLGGGPLGFADGTINISGGTLEFQSKWGIEKFVDGGQATVNMTGGFIDFIPDDNENKIIVDHFSWTGGSIRQVRHAIIHEIGGSGSLQFRNNSSAVATLSLANDNVFNGQFVGGATSSRGRIVKEGAGQLTVGGTQWTNIDGIFIEQGSIKLAANDVLPAVGPLSLANAAGVFLDLDGRSQTVRAIFGGGANGGNILLGNGGLLTTNTASLTTYSGVISGAGGIAKAGTGSWILDGPNNYSGSTTINNGVLQIAPTGAIGSGDITNGGALEVFANTSASNYSGSGELTVGNGSANTFTVKSLRPSASSVINVAANATLAVAPDGTNAGASKIFGLNLDANGRIDLNDNDMILSNADTAAIQLRIRTARNGGSWDQPGITSTAAKNSSPANKTLGLLTGPEYTGIYGAGAIFSGFVVSSSDTLIKYTYYGDTDFNGVVNFDDYSRIDAGFLNSRTGWLNGDFNYDNVVNFDDYALIDGAFLSQSGTLRPALLYLGGDDGQDMSHPSLQYVQEHFAQFGPSYANALLATVPEPATAGLAILAATTAMLGRRRRSR